MYFVLCYAVNVEKRQKCENEIETKTVSYLNFRDLLHLWQNNSDKTDYNTGVYIYTKNLDLYVSRSPLAYIAHIVQFGCKTVASAIKARHYKM